MSLADWPRGPGGYFGLEQAPKIIRYLDALTYIPRLYLLEGLIGEGVTGPLLEELFRATVSDTLPLLRESPRTDDMIEHLIRGWQRLCGRDVPTGALNYERMGEYLWQRSSEEERTRLGEVALESSCLSPTLFLRGLADTWNEVWTGMIPMLLLLLCR